MGSTSAIRCNLGRIVSALTLAVSLGLIQTGCAHAFKPEVSTAAFTGPAITIDSTTPEHHAVISAPGAGWVPCVDAILDWEGGRAMFLTLRRPNPAYPRDSGPVQQRVNTTVVNRVRVLVYARSLDADAPLESDAAYSLAAQAAGTVPAK